MPEKNNSGSSVRSISVILPIYNEASTIIDVIENVIKVLVTQDLDFEVITVDDGSNDATLEKLRLLRKTFPKYVRVVQHLINRGNGAALRSGTRIAKGSIIVYMDADGQHTPDEIQKLIEFIPPYDLVVGSRTNEYQSSWFRRVANNFYNRFASWLSRTEVQDLTSGFRAMRREAVVHFLPLFPNGFSAPTTTTLAFLKAGYNVAFLPIHVGKRAAGKSKINLWRDGGQFLLIILRMVMLFDPLRIFFPAGVILSILGFIAGVAGILNAHRLVLSNSAILFFLAAILTWLLGLIASQIASSLIYYHGDETIIVDGSPYEPSSSG
ncbi:MAG: glycosyltransferase family 2 protein [Anaerolineales bacterium]